MDALMQEARIALGAVWARRWLALGVAWALALLGWLVVAFIPNSYESTVRVLLSTDSLLADQVGITAAEQRRDFDRLEQTVTSTDNLAQVVRQTALGAGAASDSAVAAAVQTLREAIEVKADQDNLFEVTTTLSAAGRSDSATAALSREVTDRLITIVRQNMVTGGQDEASESIRILDEQIRIKGEELRVAENQRVAFQTENLGLLPGIGSASQRLSAAQMELGQIEQQLISARSALAAMNGQLAGTPQTLATPNFGGGGSSLGNGGPVAQAQGELASMRARGFTDAHPDVIAMRAQIAQMRAAAGPGRNAAVSQSPNPAYTTLVSMRAERQAAVGALEARRAAIQGDIAQMRGAQAMEPGVAARMEEIDRSYEAVKATHEKLLADREQLRLRSNVTSATDAGRFQIIDPPSLPRSPAAPNRPLLLLGVLIAAIGAGVAAAFALGQVSGSFATPEKLEKATGLTVIGSISRVIGPAQREAARASMRLFYGGSAGLAGLFIVLLAVELVARGTVA